MSVHARYLLGASALAFAAAAHAQPIKGKAALRAQAKVSGDSAKMIALHEVPNGKIRSGELERENGKLLYSFDIAVAGKPGIEEVHVDALTGAVLAHEHETKAMEKAEAKAEHAEKKAEKKGAEMKGAKKP